MQQQPFEKWFRSLYGLPCWGLHYDRQLNLSINFGQPSLAIREPYETESTSPVVQRLAASRNVTVRGEWWLGLRLCHWQLCLNNQVQATGASSWRRVEQAMSGLSGQKLVSLAVDEITSETQFQFDLGGQLTCRRLKHNSDDELWSLYRPKGYVLVMFTNGTYQHGRGADF